MNRRGFLTGLISALSAPAIVRVENIMPVKALPKALEVFDSSYFHRSIALGYEITRNSINENLYRAVPGLAQRYIGFQQFCPIYVPVSKADDP